MFFNDTGPAQGIANNTQLPFPSAGPVFGGIVPTSPSSFSLPVDPITLTDTYNVCFRINTTVANNFQLYQGDGIIFTAVGRSSAENRDTLAIDHVIISDIIITVTPTTNIIFVQCDSSDVGLIGGGVLSNGSVATLTIIKLSVGA